MSLRRLRRGEWIVVVALVALVVSLTLDWFRLTEGDGVYVLRGLDASVPTAEVLDGADGRSWTALGLPWSVLPVVAGPVWIAVLVQAARAGAGRATYGALAALVLALPATTVVLLASAARALTTEPELSVSRPGFGATGPADLAVGAWVGLAALLVGLVGLWIALADDRTSARDTVAPPTPREVPPSRPAVP